MIPVTRRAIRESARSWSSTRNNDGSDGRVRRGDHAGGYPQRGSPAHDREGRHQIPHEKGAPTGCAAQGGRPSKGARRADEERVRRRSPGPPGVSRRASQAGQHGRAAQTRPGGHQTRQLPPGERTRPRGRHTRRFSHEARPVPERRRRQGGPDGEARGAPSASRARPAPPRRGHPVGRQAEAHGLHRQGLAHARRQPRVQGGGDRGVWSMPLAFNRAQLDQRVRPRGCGRDGRVR